MMQADPIGRLVTLIAVVAKIMIDYSNIKFNFALLLKEIAARGVILNFIGDTDIIEAKLDNHVEYLINYTTRLNSAVTQIIFQDKYYSKNLLQQKGISVPKGSVFRAGEIKEALLFAEKIGYPVVIKPVNASQGHFVFANLENENEFVRAFKSIEHYSPLRCILVEEYFAGDDHRFLVIADKDIAVVKRTPPKIVGDGQSTIQQLVQAENYSRMNPRNTCLCEIQIDDDEGKRTLQKQGLTPTSILKNGQVVQLRHNANVSGGGECENILETVHPSYLALAKEIHSFFPSNAFSCIDLLIKDVRKQAQADNYAFCEFNADPGFSLHELPSKGKPHYVVRSIVDLLFPETTENCA